MGTQKILELKEELISYATHIETMLDQCITGLMEKKEDLLKEVLDTYEPKANSYDTKLDEMCTTFLAQYEPMAKDLRIVLMILKMNRDLERMGDHAVNISESGLILINRPFPPVFHDIPIMAKTSISMLKDSVNSFINNDVALARSVCERDDVVDEIGDKILLEMTGSIGQEKEDGVKRSLHIMRIAHNLERIADLSTNISEEVIYIVAGTDIKHQKGEI